MRGGPVTRRTQFSSCDECRRSRVACDASSRSGSAVDGPTTGSCTRCRNRNWQCTFKWLQGARPSSTAAPKRKARRRPASRRPASQPSSETSSICSSKRADTPVEPRSRNPSLLTSDGNSRNTLPSTSVETIAPFVVSPLVAPSPTYSITTAQNNGILSEVDSKWLQTLYREGFEAVFGSWMGRYSCPFLFGQDDIADKYVSISDLCQYLDHCIAESASDVAGPGTERCLKIGDSLRSTIAAFAARWLPITSPNIDLQVDHCALVQALWRHARRDMLRVINRPSYRSMLSLLLFALTPIPTGISEDEEADGISGQACVHTALQQVQTLRARHRNLQFNGSKVSTSSRPQSVCTGPESMATSEFINAENTAYWAALTFDTSASLTLNCRPLLSSGLFGFEAELPWRLVKTTSKVFAEATHQWRENNTDMTDERANQIIAAAASWKLLGWKLAAICKEALRDGHEEPEVQKTFTAVVDSIREFNATYRQSLEECHKRMQFLSQRTKLRWFSLMLHYHLSILMLADVIEVTDRHDLLAGLAEFSSDAENTVMNTLAFGLHNTMTLRRQPDPSSPPSSIASSETTFTVPIISIDPYPHHVVAGVQLMRKAIERDFNTGKIMEETYYDLLSTLQRTMKHLPQSSKSVQAARAKFSSTIPDGSGTQSQYPYSVLNVQGE